MTANAAYNLISVKLDQSGFHDIFNKYYVPLCVFANRYVDDSDLAADIVQDIFAKLWQIRDDFFYLHQVKGFLYSAVRNKALNELEHSKVVDEYVKLQVNKSSDSFYHDAIIEEETYRILLEAVEKLPPQMRAIINLALQGKKNAVIAEELHTSKETVHTLKKVSYKKLRILLKEHYYLLLPLLLHYNIILF